MDTFEGKIFDLHEFCKVEKCKELIKTYVNDKYGHPIAGRPAEGILCSICTLFGYDIYNVKATIELELKEGKMFVKDNGFYHITL